MGRSAPGGTFRGAAKLGLYLKIWKGGSISWREKDFAGGKNFYEGGEERAVVERKTEASEKKGRQNFSGEAANLRSAPGGRHPSYATDLHITGFLLQT